MDLLATRIHPARGLASAALASLLALSVASPAAAAPTRIPFAGVFYPCGGTNGEEWVGGNVYHFRDSENDNLWVTGNPLIDGPEVNFVNGDINLTTGTGRAHPRSTIYPVAVDGTWQLEITVFVGESGLTGRGVGHGTGELAGMTISFTNPGDVAIDPSENPCSGVPAAVLIEGEILAPIGTP